LIQQVSLSQKKIQNTNQSTKKTSNEFDSLLETTLGSKKHDIKKVSKTNDLKNKNSDKDNITDNNEDEALTKYINANVISPVSGQTILPQVQSDNVSFSVEQTQQHILENAVQTLTGVQSEDIKNIDNLQNVNQLISKVTSAKPQVKENTGAFDDFVKLNTQQTSKGENSVNFSEKSNTMSVESETTVREADFLPPAKEKINIMQNNQSSHIDSIKEPHTKQTVNSDNVVPLEDQQTKTEAKENAIGKKFAGLNNTSENDIDKSIYYNSTPKINDVYNNGNIVIKVSDDAMKTQKPAFNQVAEKILVNYKMGKPQFEMELFPKNLGKVSVKLTNQNGEIIVEILADNPKTQDLLLANSGEIKTIIQSAAKQPVHILQETQDKPWYEDMQNQQNQQNRQNQQEQQEQQNRNRVYFKTNKDDVNTEDFLSVMQKLKQQSVLM